MSCCETGVALMAVADMQETHQHWGARLYSTLPVTTANTYAFSMRVDDAARLWVKNVLVIDATCKPPAPTFPLQQSTQVSRCAFLSADPETY